MLPQLLISFLFHYHVRGMEELFVCLFVSFFGCVCVCVCVCVCGSCRSGSCRSCIKKKEDLKTKKILDDDTA